MAPKGKAAPAAEEDSKDQHRGGKIKAAPAAAAAPAVTAALKVDMHCDGCARRIRRSVRRFPGVEGVVMDVEKGTMTVAGRFDAKKLRDRVADKTKKKVDLVVNGKGGNQKGGEGKQDKEEGKGQDDNDSGGGAGAAKGKGGKKPATVPAVATVVLRVGSVGLHCDGCMRRIRTKLFKIRGVEQVRMEVAKNQVTVTGTMDVKALPAKLLKKLRRPVDVVAPSNKPPPQHQQDGGAGAAGDQDKVGKESKDKKPPPPAEVDAFFEQQQTQPYELLLSDENPNACSVM